MSNLKDLVPPLELCKLIPAEEFGGSVFAWWQCTPFEEWQVVVRSSLTTTPAPTLEEIIRKIRLDLLCGIEHHGDFYVANRHIGCCEDERAATAALRLWLKLKGIEE